MITAEQWRNGINSVLDEYGLSREEFWKDPKAFIDISKYSTGLLGQQMS